jgi:hypothetical protein
VDLEGMSLPLILGGIVDEQDAAIQQPKVIGGA